MSMDAIEGKEVELMGAGFGIVLLALFIWGSLNADPSTISAIKAEGNACVVNKLKEDMRDSGKVLTKGEVMLAKVVCWDQKKDDASLETARAQAQVLNSD